MRLCPCSARYNCAMPSEGARLALNEARKNAGKRRLLYDGMY